MTTEHNTTTMTHPQNQGRSLTRFVSAAKTITLLLGVAILAPTVHAQPKVVGASSAYARKGTIELSKAPNAAEGDVLLLFMNRSDGPLPMKLGQGGWKTAAMCLKQHNEWEQCITDAMCADGHEKTSKNGDVYCDKFRQVIGEQHHNKLDGEDLGTVVFYKVATADDVQSGGNEQYEWDLKGKTPAWAIMAAVHGADATSPIRDWAGKTCDNERQSRFASVGASAGDLLLFHQGFDDAAKLEDFQAPLGASFVAWTVGEDETAYLFKGDGVVEESGRTAEYVTSGNGGSACKDVQLTFAIASAQSPTDAPTPAPSDVPTPAPSDVPTRAPSNVPTTTPSDAPSPAPSSPPSLRGASSSSGSRPGSGNRSILLPGQNGGGDEKATPIDSDGVEEDAADLPGAETGANVDTPDVVIATEGDIFAAASSSSSSSSSSRFAISSMLACTTILMGALLSV